MAKAKGTYTVVPVEQKEMKERQGSSNASDQAEDGLERKFDKEFWRKVQVEARNTSWNLAMDKVRADRLIEDHQENVLLVIINEWPKKKKPEVIPSLEYSISRLTEIILERDTEETYKEFRAPSSVDTSRPTLLHLAAKQNFLHVARCLVERYPNLINLQTRGDEPNYLPVELALKERQDDTAAYLISQMRQDRIYRLFLCKDDQQQTPINEVFYFGNVISSRNAKTGERQREMKKTVVAVLDKLVNPNYPYLPDADGDEDEIERAISSMPDDPVNYDFFYHILEADENGRQPKIEVAAEFDEHGEVTKTKMIDNPMFNRKSLSCLRRIAESRNKEAVQHPLIRMLVSTKWDNFASKRFRIRACFYVLFLAVLSFALIYGSTRSDPTQYKGRADHLRLLCEVCSIVFMMVYLFEEIHEMIREGCKEYWSNWYNRFDCLALVFTFLVIPLRFAETRSQWSIAALGYLFNFLRLFKFSCVTRFTGLYTKTLARIIYKDMTRFAIVFAVIFLGFCGSLFMALEATNSQSLFSNFSWLMLAGVRVLAEGQSVDDDYSKFSWLAILILLAYMMMVVVILLNILIAQLSYTYSEAKKTAKLQYAIDLMVIVTRMEYSRFARWNFRVSEYLRGDWVNEEKLAKEILEYTEERHPWETVAERITSVREIMRKILRRKEKEPWECVDEKLTHLTEITTEIARGNEKEPWQSVDKKLTHLTSIVEKLPGGK